MVFHKSLLSVFIFHLFTDKKINLVSADFSKKNVISLNAVLFVIKLEFLHLKVVCSQWYALNKVRYLYTIILPKSDMMYLFLALNAYIQKCLVLTKARKIRTISSNSKRQ